MTEEKENRTMNQRILEAARGSPRKQRIFNTIIGKPPDDYEDEEEK